MIKNFLNWLGSIPTDKLLHFIMGLLFVALIATIFPNIAPCAFLASIIVGFGKEVYDFIDYGKFDFADFYFTVFGGLIIQILIWFGL